MPSEEKFLKFAALVAAEKEAQMIREGWRKCSEGQKTTQYCGLLDAAVKAEHEACKEMIATWVEDWCEGLSVKKIAYCIRGDGNDTVKPNKYVTREEPL